MHAYAGIGSRRLSESQLEACRQVAHRAAGAGWRLHTGAATGADQAFAEGALEVGGAVSLFLPWWSYEQDWVRWAKGRGALAFVLQDDDQNAWASVSSHPAADRLSRGAQALHARNFCIIRDCSWVAAFPVLDRYGHRGGTGQGILLAEQRGLPVLDLSTL